MCTQENHGNAPGDLVGIDAGRDDFSDQFSTHYGLQADFNLDCGLLLEISDITVTISSC